MNMFMTFVINVLGNNWFHGFWSLASSEDVGYIDYLLKGGCPLAEFWWESHSPNKSLVWPRLIPPLWWICFYDIKAEVFCPKKLTITCTCLLSLPPTPTPKAASRLASTLTHCSLPPGSAFLPEAPSLNFRNVVKSTHTHKCRNNSWARTPTTAAPAEKACLCVGRIQAGQTGFPCVLTSA